MKNICKQTSAIKTSMSRGRSFSTALFGCNCGKIHCECTFIKGGPASPYYKPRKFQSSVATSTEDGERNANPVEQLLANNKAWVAKINAEDPEFFKQAGSVHKPKFLYFGCSDARVPANLLLGLGSGEVFVHRNIGNLVPVNDLNALSVLEYAVGQLGVTDIMVTGHYDCGAVKGATSRQSLGLLDTWLRLIKDVYRLHQDHLDMIENDYERHKRLVELSVVEQCLNLYKTNIVQAKRYETSKNPTSEGVFPRVHPLVFDPKNGILKNLNFDLKNRVYASLDSIYGFHDLDETKKSEF